MTSELTRVENEDQALVEQLTSEYQIIQDKIDKIGSFRFTVRGWSVTLVIASIFATGSSKDVSPWLLLFLPVFILMFYFMEQKQNRFGYYFGQRALQIERELYRIFRAKELSASERFLPTPWIAYHLKEMADRSAPAGKFLWLKERIKDPDRFFYAIQTCIVILTVVFLLYVRPHANSQSSKSAPEMTLINHSQDKAPSLTATYEH